MVQGVHGVVLFLAGVSPVATHDAGNSRQRYYLYGHTGLFPYPQTKFLHAALKIVQTIRQSCEYIGGFSAPDEVVDNLLITYAHGLELLYLHDTGHIVVIVVAAAAVGSDVGWGQ